MSAEEPLAPAFYRRPAREVARDLLGRYLVRRLPNGERLVLRLVETEAYQGEGDRASHAWAGPVTPRSRRLFRDGGHAYVYLIYGMHHCLNAVAGSSEDGQAVLFRAGEPVAGEAPMRALRGFAPGADPRPGRGAVGPLRPGELAGGPGRLCQALAVDGAFDGVPLWAGDLVVAEGEPVPDRAVVRGPRVGVAYAGEAAGWPLRFAIAGHPHMSRPKLA
ncbi:MAG TPA: DNA-3-methyladenine glycosylase [Thermoanaerobaculia bacterium]|nr:DNA-3-methyladenine glycosylase [Thermoanaerobaculia bacterium]